ncbi:hypothetical protein BFL38_08245 [Brachyspira hampsonii]|uniref:Uncharacterized protein n=1 Tax=Brachyspira hampsonii TaxID=1287055 RepID=A0A1E5NFD8_9SPIR|nr:hypothetical protein [Brachyspira hampsonii]OEJ14817.1 hypothetical protein BFL38_08245 [Brachyspira hampsonii]
MGSIDIRYIKELLQKKEYEEVIHICGENLIHRYNKKNIELYLYRAIAYLNLKLYSKFIIDSSKVLDFEGSDLIIFNSKGIISFYLKSYSESISYLDKAIQLDKYCSEAYYYRGLSKFYIMSNYINSIRDFLYLDFLHFYHDILDDLKMAKKLGYEYTNIDNYLYLLDSYLELRNNNIKIHKSIFDEIFYYDVYNNIRFIDYYNKYVNEMTSNFNVDLLLNKYLINDNKYKNEIYKNKTDDPHIARLKIMYDGEMFDNHQMNASDLSLIVSSVEKIFLKINEIVNKNFVKVDVKVDANFIKGSFGIEFVIIIELVKEAFLILNSYGVTAILNANGLTEMFYKIAHFFIKCKNNKKLEIKIKKDNIEEIEYNPISGISSKKMVNSMTLEMNIDEFSEDMKDMILIIMKDKVSNMTIETNDDKETITKEDIDKNNFDDSNNDEKN